ncbi:hypothetical protein SBA6_880012 [Candidatus Sulfopaludibacter sp. SbA6]|nr:hypothetical protein SBA6_880012 [Candidatus Sulfopaludibacter sp. SbA6]
MPGLSCGKPNRPESSVFTDRFRPVSTLVTVTAAPGIAAPLGSVTDPAIALVVSPCASAGTRIARVKAASTQILGMPKFDHICRVRVNRGILTFSATEKAWAVQYGIRRRLFEGHTGVGRR